MKYPSLGIILEHAKLMFSVGLCLATAQARLAAEIDSVTCLTAHPAQYSLVEYKVMLIADWSDPYRASDVRLDLDLVSPSGHHILVPGYFERGRSGAASAWRVRFSPRETGRFTPRFILHSKGGVETAPGPDLSVVASSARGFLQMAGSWTMRFDNGEPFRGLGENLCWESRNNDDSKYFKVLHENERFNYDYLLGRLHDAGGNFTRIWMCAWNLPLEWHRPIDTERYRPDPARYNESAAARLDDLVRRAESLDVYVMLCLEHSGSLVGREWGLNSYNVANGGPAATGQEFFTHPLAREMWRDHLRYLVARWGWSSHIAVWEFFNEVDNAMRRQPSGPIPDEVVTRWHAEMAAYLKEIDPVARPVTTSISHQPIAGLDAVPQMDFNQRHIYRNTSAIPQTIRERVAQDGKPCVIGEFSYEWDWSKNFNEFAPEMDRDLKHGLWDGLFSPTPVLPLTWWWEFFDQRGSLSYFGPIRAMLDEMMAAGNGAFAAGSSEWQGDSVVHLSVRCGTSQYILLRNESNQAATGRLLVPIDTLSTVRVYDPETGSWSGAQIQFDQGKSTQRVSLRAHSQAIYVTETKRQ